MLLVLIVFAMVSLVSAGTADSFFQNAAMNTAVNYSSTVAPNNTKDIQITSSTAAETLTAASATMESLTVKNGTAHSIANKTSGAGNSTLTLGNSAGFNNAQNSVDNDLLVLSSAGSGLTIFGPNQSTGPGVLNLVLASSGNFNVGSGLTLTISSVISGSSISFTNTGSGTVTLQGANTLSGNIVINAGTLALSGSGSIANSPTIVIGGSGTFDVSGLSSTLTLGAQTLKGPSTAATGAIKAGASVGLTLGSSSSLTLPNFAPATPALTVSGGTLSLNSATTVSVVIKNSGTPLGVNDYRLISKGTGGAVVFTTTAPSVTLNGTGSDGIAAGTTASLIISGGELYLRVACSTITLTADSLPNGSVGTAYSQQITASGGSGSYTYANTGGTLPSGLTLSSAGLLSGTPDTAAAYTFDVTATDSSTACTGVQTYHVTIAAGCTTPGVPAGPAATVPTCGQVHLSWTASSPAAASYNIYRATTSGGEASVTYTVSGGSTVTYDDSTITPGQHYYYKITGVNGSCESALASSTEVDAIPPTTPAAPTTLGASGGCGSVSVTWTPPGGTVSSYNIYRSTTSGGEGSTAYATGVSGSPYNDSSVTANQTYFYKVAAVNGSCVGAQSTEASAASATPTITLGANPVVCVAATSANLTFSATSGSPDQYSIVFDAAAHTAGFTDVTLASLPASPIVITVPGAAAVATYNGALTVKNSTPAARAAVRPSP